MNGKNILGYVISLMSGGGTSLWCWERFYDALFSIVVGTIVAVLGIIFSHIYVDWGKKRKKNKK